MEAVAEDEEMEEEQDDGSIEYKDNEEEEDGEEGEADTSYDTPLDANVFGFGALRVYYEVRT